jgi:quercetin dioxygenase-like cupin family protein
MDINPEHQFDFWPGERMKRHKSPGREGHPGTGS